MTHFVYINTATGKAHSAPAADAPPAKVVIKLKSQQKLVFVFFRTGADLTVTGTHADDTFTAVGHGLANNDRIVFLDITNGYGLIVEIFYYVRDVTADTFKVSLTPGGAAVNFTTNLTAGTFRLSTVGSEIAGWVSGKTVVKHKPETAVLLLATGMVVSGSGTASQYAAEWTAATCTSTAARAYVAEETLPRDCWCEVEWIDTAGTHSVAFPIKLGPTFNSDEDGLPDIDDPATEGWLDERAVRHDAPQELSTPQLVQALENLGLMPDADGVITWPSGHYLVLNAPPP